MLHSDEESLSSSETGSDIKDSSRQVSTFIRIGRKRLRVTIDVDSDSDDEWDDWLLEDIFRKYHIRRMWMHPLNMKRPTEGEYVRICIALRQHPEKFYKYFRMLPATFDYILGIIRKDITKHSIRPSIIPEERLAVTLRYLSTGMSFEALADSYLMDDYTIGLIVKEVCSAIYENLVQKHMAVPSVDQFREVAEMYEKLWNFPNVIGALDGKHIRLKCPKKSGTMFYNYKLYFSIVLQAVVDANYRFLFVDVGAYGKQSDSGVFSASPLSKFVEDRKNFPPDRRIHGLDILLPYMLVADDAYPLRRNMMKPFSHRGLTSEEQIFNGRLSRARRCVECAFGILANKWRLLMKAIETNEYKACDIVKCLTVLHNVIIDKEGMDQQLLSAVSNKVNNVEQNKLLHLKTGRKYNRSATEAINIRNCLKDYFISPDGSVPWQERYLKA